MSLLLRNWHDNNNNEYKQKTKYISKQIVNHLGEEEEEQKEEANLIGLETHTHTQSATNCGSITSVKELNITSTHTHTFILDYVVT